MIDAPLRSLLFMPGDNARAHEKADTLDADALIFDLEDAVAPADKSAARNCIAQSLRAYRYSGKQLFLRINAAQSDAAIEDFALLASCSRFDGVVLPKVEDANSVSIAIHAMEAAGARPSLPLLPMIETPLGVLNAQSIAAVDTRVIALIAGTNDLAAALRLPTVQAQRDGLRHALSQLVLVARAYGLAVIDGVCNRIADTQGFARECTEGRALGFDGKTLIHPSQIATANAAFSPSEAEREEAQALIDQWESQQKGVMLAQNAMVEELHVRSARRVVALYKACHSPALE